jgi:hypothetical protein
MRISLHSLVKIIYKKDYRTREENYRTKYKRKYIYHKVHKPLSLVRVSTCCSFLKHNSPHMFPYNKANEAYRYTSKDVHGDWSACTFLRYNASYEEHGASSRELSF